MAILGRPDLVMKDAISRGEVEYYNAALSRLRKGKSPGSAGNPITRRYEREIEFAARGDYTGAKFTQRPKGLEGGEVIQGPSGPMKVRPEELTRPPPSPGLPKAIPGKTMITPSGPISVPQDNLVQEATRPFVERGITPQPRGLRMFPTPKVDTTAKARAVIVEAPKETAALRKEAEEVIRERLTPETRRRPEVERISYVGARRQVDVRLPTEATVSTLPEREIIMEDIKPEQVSIIERVEKTILPPLNLDKDIYIPDAESSRKFQRLIRNKVKGGEVAQFLEDQETKLKIDIGKRNELVRKANTGIATEKELRELVDIERKIERGYKGSGWDYLKESADKAEARGQKVEIGGVKLSPTVARSALKAGVEAYKYERILAPATVGLAAATPAIASVTAGTGAAPGLVKGATYVGRALSGRTAGAGFTLLAGGTSAFKEYKQTGDIPYAIGAGVGGAAATGTFFAVQKLGERTLKQDLNKLKNQRGDAAGTIRKSEFFDDTYEVKLYDYRSTSKLDSKTFIKYRLVKKGDIYIIREAKGTIQIDSKTGKVLSKDFTFGGNVQELKNKLFVKDVVKKLEKVKTLKGGVSVEIDKKTVNKAFKGLSYKDKDFSYSVIDDLTESYDPVRKLDKKFASKLLDDIPVEKSVGKAVKIKIKPRVDTIKIRRKGLPDEVLKERTDEIIEFRKSSAWGGAKSTARVEDIGTGIQVKGKGETAFLKGAQVPRPKVKFEPTTVKDGKIILDVRGVQKTPTAKMNLKLDTGRLPFGLDKAKPTVKPRPSVNVPTQKEFIQSLEKAQLIQVQKPLFAPELAKSTFSAPGQAASSAALSVVQAPKSASAVLPGTLGASVGLTQGSVNVEAQKVDQLSDSLSRSAFDSSYGNLQQPGLDQGTVSETVQDTGNLWGFDELQKPDTKKDKAQKPVATQPPTVSPLPIEIPTPPKPVRPGFPKIPSFDRRRKLVVEQPYYAEYRVRKDIRGERWRRLNKEPLTMKSALSAAARFVDQTKYVAGRVVKGQPIRERRRGGGQVKVVDTGDNYYERNRKKFTTLKKVGRVKRKLPKGRFNEKKKYQFDSVRERKARNFKI